LLVEAGGPMVVKEGKNKVRQVNCTGPSHVLVN